MVRAAEFAIPLGLALLLASRVAAADATAAEALFVEGRRLFTAGDYPAACAKFAESYRLDPAGGTLMNLAQCHEREGKTASAWSEFKDALARAINEGRDERVEEAKKQIALLEPRLAKVRVVLSPGAPTGLEVHLDGTVLGAASFGVAIPVDPGSHRITASAPGYVTMHLNTAATPATLSVVKVPVLVKSPSAPSSLPPTAPAPAADAGTGGTPASAYVLLGAGVVGVGVGSYFGLVARAKKRDSEAECVSAGCTREGKELLDEADRAAWVSNSGFGVGIGSLAVATYLFLTSGPERQSAGRLRVSPAVGPRSLGLAASAGF